MLLDDAEPVVNLLNGMHLHEKEQHPPFVVNSWQRQSGGHVHLQRMAPRGHRPLNKCTQLLVSPQYKRAWNLTANTA